MGDNWYMVLGCDPAEEDWGVIEGLIEEKLRFWSRQAHDANHGPSYSRYLQLEPEIRAAMSDPAKRRQLAAEAAALTQASIDRVLIRLGRKGYVTHGELRNFAADQSLDPMIVEQACRRLDIPRTAGPATGGDIDPSLYDTWFRSEPPGARLFARMKPWLEAFNASNFYEFLFPNRQHPHRLQHLPAETLAAEARRQRQECYQKRDSISISGNNLCEQCLLTFADEQEKAKYDQYLSYCRRRSLLLEVKRLAGYADRQLPRELAEDFLTELAPLLDHRQDLARDLLAAFCRRESISMDPAHSLLPTPENTKTRRICGRCGASNEYAEGRSLCRHCGQDFDVRCPNCGKIQDAAVHFCVCGFPLEQMDKAVALCQLAESYLEQLRLDAVKTHLARAEALWPGYSGCARLKARLGKAMGSFGPTLDALAQACSQNRFVTAKRHYETLRQQAPGYRDPDLEEEIRRVLDLTAQTLTRAEEADSPSERLGLYQKAYALCKDYPGVPDRLPPPQAPAAFAVTPDPAARQNLLTWKGPDETAGLHYVLFRGEEALPQNPTESDILATVNRCDYEDREILPGKRYVYAVFSRRAGIFSKGAAAPPVVNYFELQGLSLLPGDGFLQLSWQEPPAGARVEVLRETTPGHWALPEQVTGTGCLDRPLTNGRSYRYRVRLRYPPTPDAPEGGVTEGIVIAGSPKPPSKPITIQSVTQDESPGLFHIRFDNPDQKMIYLYQCPDKPPYEAGDVVAAGEVYDAAFHRSPLKEMAHHRLSPTQASFQYQGSPPLYLVALTFEGARYTFGPAYRVNLSRNVRVIKSAKIGADLHLHLSPPPKYTTGFLLLCRYDRFPQGINDPDAKRDYISLAQYRNDGALVLSNVPERDHYVTVFTEIAGPGNPEYSSGVNHLHLHIPEHVIQYRLSRKNGWLGTKLAILFESKEPRAFLPAVDIFAADKADPMERDDWHIIGSVPPQDLPKPLSLQIPLRPQDLRFRLRFQDPAMNSRYLLSPEEEF